jgi:hypothetical protein
MKPEALDRFWAKVAKSDGCWLWTASVGSDGYGTFGVSAKECWRVHRLAWTLEHGPIPDGMMVCHRCDVRRCVKTDHLFLGTAMDNNRDCISKGRDLHPAGSHHPLAKLSRHDVISIRQALDSGATKAALARQYGVHKTTVTRIANGMTYATEGA